jgi:DNA-directed RNA polymerase subunit H
MGHVLVPEHIILSEKEKEELFRRYNIKPDQLPKILNNDPAVVAIGAKPGDIVKIIRKSQTAKKSVAYRFVVESESITPSEVIIPDMLSMEFSSDGLGSSEI